MTKEGAIMYLTRLKNRINFEVTDAQGKMDALNMAIKALEQEPTGHWIVNKWGNISCSECGCTALYDKVYPDKSVFGKAIRVKSTFCPTCGCEMK